MVMDMFHQQLRESYCKEPESENLVKSFYQACKMVAEDRYDQLLGQIHHSQSQVQLPSKMGFLCTDSLPESLVCLQSQNSVRRKLFLSPRTPTWYRTCSHKHYECHKSSEGGEDSPFSSIPECDSDSNSLKKQESKSLEEENEQLRRDLNASRFEQKALQKHLVRLQEELRALQRHNSLLHLEASSVQSQKSALEDEVERLIKANRDLTNCVAFGGQLATNFKEELYICRQENGQLFSALKEISQREQHLNDKLKAKVQQLTQELMSQTLWEDSHNESTVLHDQEGKHEISDFLPHDTRESSGKDNLLPSKNLETEENKHSEELILIRESLQDLLHIDHVFASHDERHSKVSEVLLGISETVQCLKQKLRHAKEVLETSNSKLYKLGCLVSEMNRNVSGSQYSFISTLNRHGEKATVKLLKAHSRAVFASLQGERAVLVQKRHYGKVHVEMQEKFLRSMEHARRQAFELDSKGIVIKKINREAHTQRGSLNSPHMAPLFRRGSKAIDFQKQLERNSMELQMFQNDVRGLHASTGEFKDQNKSLKEHVRELMQISEGAGWQMGNLGDNQNERYTTVKRQAREAQITKELALILQDNKAIKQHERKIVKELLEASVKKIQGLRELRNIVKCIQIKHLASKSALKSLSTFCRQSEQDNDLHQVTCSSDGNIVSLKKRIVVVNGEILGSAEAGNVHLAEIANLRGSPQEILRQSDLMERHFANIQLDADKLSKTFPDLQKETAFLIEQCKETSKDEQDLHVELALFQEGTPKSESKFVISRIKRAGQQLTFSLAEHEDCSIEVQKGDTKMNHLETEKAEALMARKATRLFCQLRSFKFQKTDHNALAELAFYADKLQKECESLGKRSKDLDSKKGRYDLWKKEAPQINVIDPILQFSSVKKTGHLQTQTVNLRRWINLLETQAATEHGNIIKLKKRIVAFQQQNSQLRTPCYSGTVKMEVLTEEKGPHLQLEYKSDLLISKDEGCKVHDFDRTSKEIYQYHILHVEAQTPDTIATDGTSFQNRACKQAPFAETSYTSSSLFHMQPRPVLEMADNILKLEILKEVVQRSQVVLKGGGEQNWPNLPIAVNLEQRWRHPSHPLTGNLIEEKIQRPGKLEGEPKSIISVASNGAEVRQGKIIFFEQNEVDPVVSTMKDLKNVEDGLKSLENLFNGMLKVDTLVNGQFSARAFERTHYSENKVSVHAEALILLEEIANFGDRIHTCKKKVKVLIDTVHKLQVSNINTQDELLASAKREQEFKSTMRFTRAIFFCLLQCITVLKEEKETQARRAELAMQAKRKENEDLIFKLRQQVNYHEEQNKRLSNIIVERGVEKREAINQLSFSLNYMQEDNRNLKRLIKSMNYKGHVSF